MMEVEKKEEGKRKGISPEGWGGIRKEERRERERRGGRGEGRREAEGGIDMAGES
jgi:hypothetical protein